MTKTKSLFFALAKGYGELVFYLPILLVAAFLVLPSDWTAFVWLFTLPSIYVLPYILFRQGASICLIAKLSIQIAAGVVHYVLAALIAGSGVAAMALLVCGLLGAIFAGFGFAGWREGWRNSFPNARMLIGVMAYLACQPLKMAAVRFSDFATLLDCGAVIAIALFVVIANERHLSGETVDSHRTPTMAATRRLNRMLVAGLVVLIAFVLLFRRLREWLENTILSFLRSLFSRSGEEAPSPELEPQPTAAPPELPMTEPSEPSAFMKLLELIFRIGATVLLAATAAVVLYFALKKAYRLLRTLWSKLAARQGAGVGADQGFTDEVESLTSKEKRRRGKGAKQGNSKPGLKIWSELGTNAERVRYLYRQWLQEQRRTGYEAKSYLSPRETVEDIRARSGSRSANDLSDLVSLYELARYGEREPSDEAVEKQRLFLNPERKRRK